MPQLSEIEFQRSQYSHGDALSLDKNPKQKRLWNSQILETLPLRLRYRENPFQSLES